jgi:hypothetical protein
VETEDNASNEQEASTAPSEMLSQLPDAPTENTQHAEDSEEPSSKKSTTAEADDDDFVVVEKEDAVDDKPKAEL